MTRRWTLQPVRHCNSGALAMADEGTGQTIPLTEAEYAVWAAQRTDAMVAELNEKLGHLLPDGIRFEWT